MRKISYNYAFVFYDVNEKRVQKVFKICKKYAFSSSVGDYTVYDDDEYVGKLLKQFNKIAVREEKAQKNFLKLYIL